MFGKASNFDSTLDLSSLDGNNGFRLDGVEKDLLGFSVSSAGDVNDDGFDDLIIGAPYAEANGEGSGSSYVVFGKASPFEATINLSNVDSNNGFRLDGVEKDDALGSSVSNAGDVNGDGFDDLIVGASGAFDQNSDFSGSSYVLFGRSYFTSSHMIEGTSGDDTLVGDDGYNNINGNDGNDTMDGRMGDDLLTGGLGNDILLAGFGEDQLSGSEGKDIFGFYAPGHFEVQDLNLVEDHIYFDLAQTGLSNIDEVNKMITAVNQREDGVEVEFGPEASIDLIGINFAEITAEMVGFA